MKRGLIQLAAVFACLLIYNFSIAQRTGQRALPAWAFGGFVRPQNINPIISPDSNAKFPDPMSGKMVGWEANYTFNPAATVKNGKIVVLYRSEDKTGVEIGTRTSRIGYAESGDGISFKRKGQPVLFPAKDSQKEFEWPGGCEDPRVAMTENGTYVMFYTQWNRKVPRLGAATSKDLVTWVKHGPIFRKANGGKFFSIANKSASILTKLEGGRQVIAKIKGKYWMYWGEQHVYAATSANLVDWAPLTDSKGELKWLLSPRKGFFDSDLTECGPPAILTKKGIVLFYNGKNHPGAGGDQRFNGNSYCAGQALFSASDPSRAIARLDVPFLRPIAPFEKAGNMSTVPSLSKAWSILKKNGSSITVVQIPKWGSLFLTRTGLRRPIRSPYNQPA